MPSHAHSGSVTSGMLVERLDPHRRTLQHDVFAYLPFVPHAAHAPAGAQASLLWHASMAAALHASSSGGVVCAGRHVQARAVLAVHWQLVPLSVRYLTRCALARLLSTFSSCTGCRPPTCWVQVARMHACGLSAIAVARTMHIDMHSYTEIGLAPEFSWLRTCYST